MKQLALISVFLLVACNKGVASTAQLPKDATMYASRIAESVSDAAECKKYRDEIMSHAGGEPSDHKTLEKIDDVQELAKSAGCVR